MRFVIRCLFAMRWVGVLVSGLFSYASAEEQADAIEEENQRNRQDTKLLNKIRLQQYERERRFEENKFRYQQNQDKIRQFENMVNTNAALKDRMSNIWEG